MPFNYYSIWGCTKGEYSLLPELEYERLDDNIRANSQLKLQQHCHLCHWTINVPCVYEISGDQQRLALDKLSITMEEAHALEQSIKQQSSSAKWQAARVMRVTASHFGDILLRCSFPIDVFIISFLK